MLRKLIFFHTILTHKNDRESKVQAELQKWKMNFSSQPCEIDARALPPESLMFGNVIKDYFFLYLIYRRLKRTLLLFRMLLNN